MSVQKTDGSSQFISGERAAVNLDIVDLLPDILLEP